MSTQTQTIRKLPVQPGRTHDYLYDKVHVLASERDHARATFKAHTGTSRVKQVPIYQTMFSELRHYPRFQMRLDVTDPVPQFVNRQWPGYNDQHRETVIRYKTFNYAPHLKLTPMHYENANVTGVNRYKYFRRPIIPFLQQVPPDVVLASARHDTYGPQDTFVERPITPLTRTVEIQTDYRDGEAQTDPYTPEYVIRPGEQPELLTLATLSYGRGLPAGLAEVEMIERARAKRAWEATLPPLNDVSQLEKRQKMMDEMETKEWALREQEIEKLQASRLEVLKQLLCQREENQQNLNIRRLDKVWSIKQEEKERKVKQIRKEHIKAIRKLTKRRREVEGKLERRDIVHDLSDPGSQAYAPLTRIGVFLDRGSEQYVVKSKYLSSYQGLLELEQSLPTYVLNPRINAPKPRTVTKTGFIRRKQRQEEELRELHEVIKEMKNKEEEQPKPLKFLQKIEKPVARPPTPAVDVPSEEDEEQELAVIFLQKIIRGRAIQNMMFEGKEKRMELIKELRSTHALQEAEQQVKKQDKQATLALQRQRRLHEHKESFVDECLAQMEGRSVGSMLEFLTKELVRLQEERRIHAFAMLAERQRRLREAEESGRRQVEERRRREHDEIFKQVTKVHQVTVDTYLENIILDAVNSTADEQARVEVQEMADKINDVAYELEESRSKLESEEIVSELIHCFLIPEAEKSTLRERVNRQQRKYLLAAHKEIHKDGSAVIADHKNPDVASSGRSSRASDRPGSKTSQGSIHNSVRSDTERRGSHPERSASQDERPGSEAERSGSEAERSGSQAERSGSQAERSGSQTERSGSQAERSGSQTERSGSQTEKPEFIAPDQVTPPGSGPTSQTDKPVSRKGSSASQAECADSKHGSGRSSIQERSASQPSLQGKVPSPMASRVQSETSSPRASPQEIRRSSVQSQKSDLVEEIVEPEIAELQGVDEQEEAEGTPVERPSSQTSHQSQKAPSPDRPASKASKHSDKGSRPSSRQSLTEKPSSKTGSRPTSAGCRPGSARSGGSRKSSTGKVESVDLAIEGKSSPSGSKPPSRHSSTASVRSGKQSPLQEDATFSGKSSRSSTKEEPASRKSSDASQDK